MSIAFTIAPGRGDIDLVLADLADRLQSGGIRACGTVQKNTESADKGPCAMDVKVLPDGPQIRISQSLGKAARGCRLDPGALERAVDLASERLANGADVLIINKFGKHEAEGRGFRDLIAEALSRGIPVLVGLSSLNEAAFMEFSTGLAVRLQPDVDDLAAWIEDSVVGTRDVA